MKIFLMIVIIMLLTPVTVFAGDNYYVEARAVRPIHAVLRGAHNLLGGIYNARSARLLYAERVYIQAHVQRVSDQIQLGMSGKEVASSLGVSPVVVTCSYQDVPVYRFDVMAAEGYYFYNPYGIDFVDFDGLRAGDVRIIVFFPSVLFDARPQSYKTIYYAVGNMIYESRYFNNGYHRHSMISWL